MSLHPFYIIESNQVVRSHTSTSYNLYLPISDLWFIYRGPFHFRYIVSVVHGSFAPGQILSCYWPSGSLKEQSSMECASIARQGVTFYEQVFVIICKLQESKASKSTVIPAAQPSHVCSFLLIADSSANLWEWELLALFYSFNVFYCVARYIRRFKF